MSLKNIPAAPLTAKRLEQLLAEWRSGPDVEGENQTDKARDSVGEKSDVQTAGQSGRTGY
ncbi:MAG: hypothetical protein KGI75_22070 [Rhizobiaceae bacterium]|nr:hypothetical protein [Rhizobiaceae bacterium]